MLPVAKRIVAELFGPEGERWWNETESAIKNPKFDEMDPDERDEASKRRDRIFKAEDKWKAGGEQRSSGGGGVEAELRNAVGAIPQSNAQILAAWVRSMKGTAEAEWLGTTTPQAGIQYTLSSAAGYASGSGTVTSGGSAHPVRVYRAPIKTQHGSNPNPAAAYVALWGVDEGGGGGGLVLGLVLVFVGALVAGGVAFAVGNAHASAMRELARELDRLGSTGDPGRGLRARGGEAGAVARAVERMVANLDFRSKHGSADLDEVVEREQRIAQEIHGALMSKNPPRLADYEVETLFKPGFEIGGDHFEYFRIDETHVGIILLDTNARGIPAALVMSATKAYVRSAAPGNLSPAEVLRQVNRNLSGDLPPGRHVTALYAVLDTENHKVTVASAGHLPLIVYRHEGRRVAKVNPEGIALGLDVGPVFERALQEGEIPVGAGDRIVMYTDGALKVQDAAGEEFGESRFYAAVSREAPKNSQAFVNFVGSAIDQFHIDTPQNDDVTISTLKRLK
jgi:serine phosphatase RsbU (regulator of sigma subunit)